MIFETQSVIIELQTRKDLTNISAAVIKFKRPDGTTGQWPATIIGESFYYHTSNTDLIGDGVWVVQAYGLDNGTENKYGRLAKITIDKHL